MGKKSKKKKVVSANGKPFVSVCTPTYNRRKFIPYLIKSFKQQTYPKQLIEWIIIDDGEDCVKDLFEGVECVKYFRYDEKLVLGNKRNIMHEKCKGDIIVYMDDDDFYPPDRINHAVNKLMCTKNVLVAGSSKINIYFKNREQMFQFGPYGPNHATAGTFAFKKELLQITRYEDDAKLAEEKQFLKNYTIPMVQLNPEKTILVFAHDANTFDKNKLLESPDPQFIRRIAMKPKNYIKNKELLNFYVNA
jgi:glycosyltransferase involved in cell wall biosynthesis